MLKHKIQNPIVKHKELMPWQLHPPGSACAHPRAHGHDSRHYRAHLNADAFIWMVYWSGLPDHPFNLDDILNYWWTRAFNKPFPHEGGITADLVDRVYRGLIDRGHDSARIEPQESDYELPGTLLCSEQWEQVKNSHVNYIQPEQEAYMTKILKKPVSMRSKKTGTALPKAAKTVTETESSGDIPAWITSSKPGTKAHDSKVKVCELLMERQYSDEEIALMVESELEYKLNSDRVAFYRKTLNKGQFEPLGYGAPDPAVIPIEKDASAPVKPSKPASASKTLAAKPSAAKGRPLIQRTNTIGKKKLIIKKK